MEPTLNQIIPSAPRIGDKAPRFTAVSTQGEINFPADYQGAWVMLFSHPADFTPVCTSELIIFAALEDKFKEANCNLVGLSVDGLFCHISWLRTIKDKIEFKDLKNIEVKFPLIEDNNMVVAKEYGMIMPGESNTKAVRAVFFIDPNSVIRCIFYYPLSIGRSSDELYRVLIALQTADEFGLATPADWRPGEEVITSPSWYFCTKKLDKVLKRSYDQRLKVKVTLKDPDMAFVGVVVGGSRPVSGENGDYISSEGFYSYTFKVISGYQFRSENLHSNSYVTIPVSNIDNAEIIRSQPIARPGGPYRNRMQG